MKKRLKDLCTGYTKNIAFKDLSNNEGQYPIYGASGFVKNIDYYVSDKPYIGIVKDGAGVGRTNAYPAYSSLLGTMQYIVPNDEVDLHYLKYALQALKLGDTYSGAAIPHIYFRDYQTVKIRIGSVDEQKAIAHTLIDIENAVENKRQQAVELDELIKSRFVEMFGDVSVNDKNWTMQGLSSLGTLKNGMNFHYDDKGVSVRVLGVGDFKDNSVIDNAENLSLVTLAETPATDYYLQNHDLIFVRSNGNKALVGRCVEAMPNDIPTVFSGFCIRFRNESNAVNIKYLLYFFKQDEIRAKIAGRGANIQNLNQKILSAIDVPLPPLELQNRFAEFVQKTEKAKAIVKAQIKELQELFDSKMNEYFG